MAGPVASGGSSTINGVVYQLLWTLLRVAKLRVATSATHSDTPPECVTLVLEPKGGGGDLQLMQSSGLVVEQIKARADGGTWSLREVIEDVLPDLFLAAVPAPSSTTTFRFVTEGRMGAWNNVYGGFFRNIKNRDATGDPLADLDDSTNLSFTRQTNAKTPFFPEPCSERGLFLKVAEVISERSAVKKLNLTETELHRHVRVILANFEFVDGQDVQFVQSSIDTLLLSIVDKQDDIPKIRDHLAMALATASTVGGVEIDASSFLSKHGFDAAPLTDWTAHIESARRLVGRASERTHYNELVDVRARDLPAVPSAGQILVLTGESGTGKTWLLNALARRATGPLLPILTESEGTADATLQKCASLFWNDIHDGDQVLPLSRAAKRLKKVTRKDPALGLAVFIDGVRDYEEARRLVEQDWEAWSSSLVLACHPEHANSLQNAYPSRVQVYECRNFTWEELHDYVGRRLETGWAEIPIDVRETLRRPLMAGIYCEEFGEAGWESPSEYELCQRVWDRLSTGQQSDWPLDVGCVEHLARSIREGSPYPWSQRQLRDAGIDNDALKRLQRIGWLVATGDRYQVFHDRLLQWAVARSLCSDLCDGEITAESLVDIVADQTRPASVHRQISLGYIPMDVLWMLNQGEGPRLDVAEQLLESLEDIDHRYTEDLYDHLVPTLGECVADAVYNRVRNFEGYPWTLKRITKCLATVGSKRISEFASALIESDDRMIQRRGVNLLRLVACPPLLDQLWEIHKTGQFDPTAFGVEETESWLLYNETFDALKRSAREDPDWVHGAIEQSNPTVDPVHDLGWLVANLNDSGVTWRAVKTLLFEKVPDVKPRCLVANIATYRDSPEIEWLDQWVGSKVDHVASSTLQALSRLDPDAAVAALQRMDPFDVYASRQWSFGGVFEARPTATHAEMLKWMKMADDPWSVAFAFTDRENDIITEQLDIILDALCTTLNSKLYGECNPRRGVHLERARSRNAR